MSQLDQQVRQQIAHAYQNAPAIKALMDGTGVTPDDIQTTDDLGKIPVTSKERLQELQQENPPFGGFLAVAPKDLRRIYLSPGPLFDPEGYDDDGGAQAAKQAFSEAGFGEDDIVINAFLYHMVPAGLALDAGVAQVGATVVPMGPGNTDVQVMVMMRLGATGYCGTPSFLEMILAKVEEMGIPKAGLPLKKAFFSAEPYTPSQRQKFEGDYGLVTAQAYATADLGIIGYEVPGKQGLYVPDNLVVQVCSPETGEILPHGELGEVVVTTFNKAYPLIRFGTGDLSIMDAEGVRLKLRGWMGRSGEAIKVRGMFLHPNALRAGLAAFENIEKFQAVVERDGARDVVTLQVILSGGTIDEDAIKSAVTTASRLTINKIEVVDSIEGSRLVRDARQFD